MALARRCALACDELEAGLGRLHPGRDVFLDEIVGEVLGHVGRDLGRVRSEVDLEGVDFDVARGAQPGSELGKHGVHRDVAAHRTR